MEEARNRGDWSNVMKESRPVIELLRDKQLVQDTLQNANFPQEAIDQFQLLIKSAFDYASKFIHKISNQHGKQVIPPIPVQREDALFMYSLCVNGLHVLVQKTHRFHSVVA
jgi:hypothetical protein